jgi:hypothetical protein
MPQQLVVSNRFHREATGWILSQGSFNVSYNTAVQSLDEFNGGVCRSQRAYYSRVVFFGDKRETNYILMAMARKEFRLPDHWPPFQLEHKWQ